MPLFFQGEGGGSSSPAGSLVLRCVGEEGDAERAQQERRNKAAVVTKTAGRERQEGETSYILPLPSGGGGKKKK